MMSARIGRASFAIGIGTALAVAATAAAAQDRGGPAELPAAWAALRATPIELISKGARIKTVPSVRISAIASSAPNFTFRNKSWK